VCKFREEYISSKNHEKRTCMLCLFNLTDYYSEACNNFFISNSLIQLLGKHKAGLTDKKRLLLFSYWLKLCGCGSFPIGSKHERVDATLFSLFQNIRVWTLLFSHWFKTWACGCYSVLLGSKHKSVDATLFPLVQKHELVNPTLFSLVKNMSVWLLLFSH
jgi:hypothetical protein